MTQKNKNLTVQSFGLLRRRSDFSRDQFVTHWRDVHGPLGLRTLPAVKQYVQNYKLEADRPLLPDLDSDGIAETWFASVEEAAALPSSEAYKTGLFLDEPNFMNTEGTDFLICRQIFVGEPATIGSEDPGVKLMIFLKRNAGSDLAAFEAAMPGALNNAVSGAADIVRTSYSVVLPEWRAIMDPTYDLIVEIWWPDASAYEADWAKIHPAFESAVGPHVDIASSHAGLFEENRMLWIEDKGDE